MVELALDAGSRFGISVEVRSLAGDFEMAAAGEAAGDRFFFDDLFDEVDRLERGGVHALDEFTAVARDQCWDRQLHSGEDHPAIAAACSRAERFRLEDGYVHAALGKSAGRGKPAEARADNGYIDGLGKRLGHTFCRLRNGVEP